MKKLDLHFVSKDEIQEEQYLAVEVDVDAPFSDHLQLVMDGKALKRRCFRGTVYYILIEENERGYITLKVACKVPKDFGEIYFESFMHQMKNSIRANAYPDFCWLHSDGTTNKDLAQVATELREGAILGDLTNILPSKFADDFAEMMHVLNQGLIAGILEDGIIYGPFIFNRTQLNAKTKFSETGELV